MERRSYKKQLLEKALKGDQTAIKLLRAWKADTVVFDFQGGLEIQVAGDEMRPTTEAEIAEFEAACRIKIWVTFTNNGERTER